MTKIPTKKARELPGVFNDLLSKQTIKDINMALQAKNTQIVTLNLTLDEAEELLYVAGNGWGDGDLYSLNHRPTKEDRKRAEVFCEARDKVSAVIQKLKRQRRNER